jgi:predicted permease
VQDPERVVRMQNDILDKIAAIPGVVSAAFSTTMPTEGQPRNAIYADNTAADVQVPPLRVAKFVSPGLFKMQGTPLIAGRDFTWTDIYEKRPVAIVSGKLARETWGEVAAALGRRLRAGAVGEWHEVIGIAADVHDEGVHQPSSATVYWPAAVQAGVMTGPPSAPRSVVFAVRTDRVATESLLNEIRHAVWSVNANLPLAQVQTLADVYRRSIARTTFTLLMLAIAGVMALALGLVGIYGVMSYTVSQRTREISIRLALGAAPASVQRRFVRQGLTLAALGVGIGVAVAVPLTSLMASLLFGIQPVDLPTFVVVAMLLAIAAGSASYVPARRASAVDPAEALKAE